MAIVSALEGFAGLNIKQIKYFVSVAQRNSLSAAAKDQSVTVQAVSKAIADLEAELGSKLFVRESRGVRLTPAGGLFLRKATKAVDSFVALETFSAEEEAQSGDDTVKLLLCAPQFDHDERACANLSSFLTKHLGRSVQVSRRARADACRRALEEHTADGYFAVGSANEENLDSIVVGTVGPAVIMLRNHRCAKLDRLTLDDIARYPFSVPQRFDYFYDSIMSRYRDDARFGHMEECDASSTRFVAFLLKGGLVMVPNIQALGGMFPGTVMRPIDFNESVAVPVCFVHRKGESDNGNGIGALMGALAGDLFVLSLGNRRSSNLPQEA